MHRVADSRLWQPRGTWRRPCSLACCPGCVRKCRVRACRQGAGVRTAVCSACCTAHLHDTAAAAAAALAQILCALCADWLRRSGARDGWQGLNLAQGGCGSLGGSRPGSSGSWALLRSGGSAAAGAGCRRRQCWILHHCELSLLQSHCGLEGRGRRGNGRVKCEMEPSWSWVSAAGLGGRAAQLGSCPLASPATPAGHPSLDACAILARFSDITASRILAPHELKGPGRLLPRGRPPTIACEPGHSGANDGEGCRHGQRRPKLAQHCSWEGRGSI